jgi:hypothetical protein
MFSRGLNMKFIYITSVSITLVAIVIFVHTKNLYASSMCVNPNTASLDETVGSSLPENTRYNFLDVVIDHSIN